MKTMGCRDSRFGNNRTDLMQCFVGKKNNAKNVNNAANQHYNKFNVYFHILIQVSSRSVHLLFQ